MKVKSCPSNGSEEKADILAMLIKVFEIFPQVLQPALDALIHPAEINTFRLGNLLDGHSQVEPSKNPLGLFVRQLHHRSVELIAELFVLQDFFRGRRVLHNGLLNAVVAVQGVVSFVVIHLPQVARFRSLVGQEYRLYFICYFKIGVRFINIGIHLPKIDLLHYQFTRRADLSIVLFIAFCALSLTVWAAEWQLCWLNPCVWALSDDFSNLRVFRSVAWMRLTWLAALIGIWTVSWLCIRQYGKGVFSSLARSVRRLYRPVIALALLACSGAAYAAQPFIDHSNPDLTVMSFYEIPYAEGVTFVHRTAQVFPDTDAGTVTGRASYQFQNTSGQEQSVSFGINPGYAISNVQANGADVPFTVSAYQEYNEALLEVTIPAEEDVELTMEYSGFPQESLPTMQGGKELSGEYLCLENSALSPRVMNVMPGDAGYPAEIEITLPENMLAIPFGSSEAKVVAKHEDGTRTWRYEQNGAGGILYAGDYIREDIEAGGMTIQFYYGRKHQAVMEAAKAVDAVKEVVDYCTEHYGSLSFGTGETLKLIQSRVAGGGYATTGASLLDEADFTAANLGNTEKGGGTGEVMIHELVHQW